MSYAFSSESAWKYRALKAEAELQATKQELSDFKQEVSDALHVWYDGTYPPVLDRFLIPAPKPDPLAEALKNMDVVMERLEAFRAALDDLGFEIREKNDD